MMMPLSASLPDDWTFNVGRNVRTFLAALAVEHRAQDLANDLPGRRPFVCVGGSDETCQIFKWQEADHTSSIDTCGTMSPDEFNRIKAEAKGHLKFSSLQKDSTLMQYFSSSKFLVVVNSSFPSIISAIIEDQIRDWFFHCALANAELINQTRVERAIPTPPAYDVGRIQSSCWIVENDTAISQGTAFYLEGVGFITCAHVVLDAEEHAPAQQLKMFHTSNLSVEYRLTDFRLQKVLDLAIFQSDAEPIASLKRSSIEDFAILSHVAVCGFPNYRKGDSCFLSPGLIVAHRTVSGVRRMITNAPIVAGMSGGPAISAAGEVMGILTHGAKSLTLAGSTEDHSILPVSAIDLLLAQ